MGPGTRTFGAQLKTLRELAGFTQEELATIAGLSVHAVSALERGERRRPHVDTVRALSAALELTTEARDLLVASSRAAAHTAVDEFSAPGLPLPPTVLVGREADLQVLRQWAADPMARLITLVGPGGVGKTRLALELAHALANQRAVRVRFAPLAAIRDAGFVASAIAEALGLADVASQDLPSRARAACRDSPTLLVLDNFEHVAAAARLIADLLAATASLRLLVTSRAPLRVRGERQYAVGPLASAADPEAMSSADLARVPAVRLFVERVRDVEPDFRLTSANAAVVAAICRRLDALPLALELAAPWVKTLAPEGLLRQLERDVLLSTSGPRDLPERQQTMNATVAWSYQLLGPGEQRAFRRFGALPGLFPIDAAVAVLAGRSGASAGNDEALQAAASLIDKSLLVRAETSVVPTCPLYYMLETVRAYAALQLNAEDRDDAFEGLVRYCRGEAALAAEGLVGPAQVDWLDRAREDLESYRSVLEWLLEQRRPAEACDIAWGLMWFWVIRGPATEGLRWYEQILSQPFLPPAAETRALLGAAAMSYMLGAIERERPRLARAMTIARESGDSNAVVHAEWLSGHLEYAAGRLDEARACFARSVEGFRTAAESWGTGHALTCLAWVSLANGDEEQAERVLNAATEALRRAGPWFLSLGLYIRAMLAARRKNAREAIVVVRESLSRIRQLQDRFAFVYALVPLMVAAGQMGDDAWVARIAGVRAAATERTGATVVDPLVHGLCERTERDARGRLGAVRWAEASAAGRRTSIDGLLEDIDRALA